jgi:CRP-like cAMP-binding protein
MTALLPSPHDPRQNQLIASLSQDVFDRIFPHLELVAMPLGEIIYESGRKMNYIYFPTSAIISLHYIMENGAMAEIAGIGREGAHGISLLMGETSTTSRAAVYSSGHGYRIQARLMMDEFNRAGQAMRILLRYTQSLISHISQTAVCNRHHSVEQQLCRLLLQTLDRLPGNELTMTQELIAGMLGVRREGITETAGNLQRLGLISYRRGHITILNRIGLESCACECYQVVKQEYRRLHGDTGSSTHKPVTRWNDIIPFPVHN